MTFCHDKKAPLKLHYAFLGHPRDLTKSQTNLQSFPMLTLGPWLVSGRDTFPGKSIVIEYWTSLYYIA